MGRRRSGAIVAIALPFAVGVLTGCSSSESTIESTTGSELASAPDAETKSETTTQAKPEESTQVNIGDYDGLWRGSVAETIEINPHLRAMLEHDDEFSKGMREAYEAGEFDADYFYFRIDGVMCSFPESEEPDARVVEYCLIDYNSKVIEGEERRRSGERTIEFTSKDEIEITEVIDGKDVLYRYRKFQDP